MLAQTNALGETNHTIFWGIKNYVEGGNYLGVVTWVLALLGLIVGTLERQAQYAEPSGDRGTKPSSAYRRSVRCTPGSLPGWRCSRCSLPLARRSTPCSTTACPAGINCTAPSAGSFPLRLSMAVLAAAVWTGCWARRNCQCRSIVNCRESVNVASACARPSLSSSPRLAGSGRRCTLVAASISLPAPFIASASSWSMAAIWRRWPLPTVACSGAIRRPTWPTLALAALAGAVLLLGWLARQTGRPV